MIQCYQFVRNRSPFFISLLLVLATCLNATATQHQNYSVRGADNTRTLVFGKDGETYEFNIERASEADKQKHTYQSMLNNPALLAFSAQLRKVARTNPARAVEMLAGAKNVLGKAAGMGKTFAKHTWKFTTVDFPAETLGFYAAQFAIVLRKLAVQAAWDGPADPAALISFWHHVSSPAGIVGFYGFMVGSLATRHSMLGLVHLAATMNGLTLQTVPVGNQPLMVWQRDAQGKIKKSLTKGVRLQAKVLNSNFVKQLRSSYAGAAAANLGIAMNFGANVSARALAGFILYFQKFLFQHATMGVGMMASTFIEELWHDEDVSKCAELSLKIKIVEESGSPVSEGKEHNAIRTCEKAYSKWTWSEKAWDFTPHFLSLSAAVVINSAFILPAVNAAGKAVKNGTGFSVRKVGGKKVYVVSLKYMRIGFRTLGQVGSTAATYWPWGAGILVKGVKVFWPLFWLMGTAEVLEAIFVAPAQVIRHSWKNLNEDVDAKLEEAVQKDWNITDVQAPVHESCQRMGGWWSALLNVGQSAFGFGCDTNNKDIAKDFLSSLKRRSTRMKKYRDLRLMPFNSAVSGWQTYTGNLINVGFGAMKAYPAISAAAAQENALIQEEAKKGILGKSNAQSTYGYTPGTNADFYAGIEVEGLDQLKPEERTRDNIVRLYHSHISKTIVKKLGVHLVESNKISQLLKDHGFEKEIKGKDYYGQLVVLWNALHKDLRQDRDLPRTERTRLAKLQSHFKILPIKKTMFSHEFLAQLAIYFYLSAADNKKPLEGNPLIAELKKYDAMSARRHKTKLFVDYEDPNLIRVNLVLTGLRVLRNILSLIPPNHPDTYPLRWLKRDNFRGLFQVLDAHGKLNSAHQDEETKAAEEANLRKKNPFFLVWSKIGRPWPLEPGERFMLKLDRDIIDPGGVVRKAGLFATSNDNALTPTLTEHFVAGMACGHNYSLPEIVNNSGSWSYYLIQPFNWVLEQIGAVRDRSLERTLRSTNAEAVRVEIEEKIKIGDYATALNLIAQTRMSGEYNIVWDNFKGMYGLMAKFQPHRITNTSFNPCSQSNKKVRGHELHSQDGSQKYYGLFDVLRHRLGDEYKSKESLGRLTEQIAFAVGGTYFSYKQEFAKIVRSHFFKPYNDDKFYRLDRTQGSASEYSKNSKGLGWLQRYGQFWGEQYKNVLEWWYDVEVVPMDQVYKKKKTGRLTKVEIDHIKKYLSTQGPFHDPFKKPGQPLPPEKKAALITPYQTTEFTAAGIRNNLMQEFLFLVKVLDALAVSYAQSTDKPEDHFIAYRRAKSGLRIQFGKMLDSLNQEETLHNFQNEFARLIKTFHGLTGFFNPLFASNPALGYEEASKDETSMKKISSILFSLENREKKEYKTRSISFVLDQMKDLMLEANKYHAMTETIKVPDQMMQMPAMSM